MLIGTDRMRTSPILDRTGEDAIHEAEAELSRGFAAISI